MSQDQQTWTVVGGGLLGMTLAYRLAHLGHRVTLLEAAPQLGGLASAWSFGGITWDRHYHVTLLSDTSLRSLLAELNCESDIEWVQTRTGFYTSRGFCSMSNLWEFLRFPVLNLIEKLRLGLTIAYAARIRDWQSLENVPVETWLRRLSGTRTTDKVWLPLLRSKLGESYKDTSAAFIWAIIARMYAARRTGLKREMFGYVRGGYGRILDRFASALQAQGVTIRCGYAAESIRATHSGDHELRLSDGTVHRSDRVVVTTPARVAARTCLDLTEQERARLTAVRYQGIVCASVVLAKPLAGFYVTNITEEWAPFTAIIEMTALVDPATFGGRTLVYLPKYVAPDDPIFSESDGQIQDRFVAGLCRMHPHITPADVLAFRVSRVRDVFALPVLGYSSQLPPVVTSVPGLFVLNSSHIVNGTLNVNETVRLADTWVSQLVRTASTLETPAPYAYEQTAR
ncbi:MAG TPA: NAD(P)/FAD-dependent oxidoreductase [Bryobacteraceae bacterium]|nr:NAD(P)/FAD-dependent oxidoreductase [Bryobacteraceae bacterium]